MGKNEAQQTSGDWKYLFAGAIAGGIIISLAFRSFFCLYTFQVPSATLLFTVASILIGLISNQLKRIESELTKQVAYVLIGGLFVATLVMLATFFTVNLTKNYCVKDFDKLKALIEMEGQAVVNKDINSIHNIYSADAVISRRDTNEDSQAYVYYSQKFAEEDHCNVNHSDYSVTAYSKDQVTMTTSSMGSYGLHGGSGCTIAYANPPGSDLWVFRKIGNEWKIVHFEFNRKVE